MLFKAAILVLIGLTQVLASPVDENLLVPNTGEASKGMLNVHSETAAGTRRLTSDASTLAGSVVCSGSHKASVSSCKQLIQGLRNDGGRTLSTSPRSICFSQSGQNCCISWSKPAPNLQKSDLVNSAVKVLNQCSDGQSVSALERGVELHGTFGETQCLSNRANGCS